MDYRNIRRDLLSYISSVDVQLVVDQFTKKKKSPGCCFKYGVDCHEQLCRVFLG